MEEILVCNEKNKLSYSLLNPQWFFEHNFTPIFSYMKCEIFMKECIEYSDVYENNLCHILCLNIKKINKPFIVLLKWLVKIGVSFNKQNKKKMTPFHYIISYWVEKQFDDISGFSEYEDLIMKMADTQITDKDGNTFIHMMCMCIHTQYMSEKLKEYVNTYPNLLKVRNEKKQLPLNIAMSSFHERDKKLLYYVFLKTPTSSWTLCDYLGRNIYHLTIEYGIIELIKYFWEKYPNYKSIPIQNESRMPSVFLAVINCNVSVFNLFVEHHPDSFLEKTKEGKDIFDIILHHYLISKKESYLLLFKRLYNLEAFKTHENKRKIKEYLDLYQRVGNYYCHICCDNINDIRQWQKPFVCKNHESQLFHMDCMKQWIKTRKCCPMCDYKNEDDNNS